MDGDETLGSDLADYVEQFGAAGVAGGVQGAVLRFAQTVRLHAEVFQPMAQPLVVDRHFLIEGLAAGIDVDCRYRRNARQLVDVPE